MGLKLTKPSRNELLANFSPLYMAAQGVDKTRILTGFLEATGYSRKHAIYILNHRAEPRSSGSGRRAKLSAQAVSALIEAWHLANRICAKRLTPFLPELLDELAKSEKLSITESERRILLNISASTVDRALKSERRKFGRSKSTTRRSTLLKSKVPVRTFTEWNDVTPGFFEIDTVSHCASSTAGQFLSTLNMTDIATCWTESFAMYRKGAVDVIAALDKAKTCLPFAICGLDFDNGSEFLNEDLIRWCDENKVTYTRSREYKKNDQAWIEEKNGSVVRKLVGRERYEGKKTWKILIELYAQSRLYINFFQPSQKLLYKRRNGAKTYRKYDSAKTPYQRVLDHPLIDDAAKDKLRETRAGLSMVEIKAKITKLQQELRRCAIDAPNPLAAAAAAQRMAAHKFTHRVDEHTTPGARQERRIKMKEIKSSIKSLPIGSIISAKDFLEHGERGGLDELLSRLAKSGELARVAWGQYEIRQNDLPVSR